MAAAPRSARVPLRRRLAAWRELHAFGLVSGLGRVLRRPWATGLTVAVMALALALPMLLGLAVLNLQRLAGSWEDSREVSLFLDPALPDAAVDALAAQLRDDPDVAALVLRTPADGLEEIRGMAEFSGALDVLGGNPLPAVLVVTPRVAPEALLPRLEALDGVELVQHDALWRQRLDAWLHLGERSVQALAVLLLLGALLVVGNTVRLDVQGRSEEIAVIQLLGGTAGFIRRPFLYLGAWYGLLAGLLAVALLAMLRLGLAGPVDALVASYDSGFRLQGFGIGATLAVPCGAAVLGWLGAFLAVGHHLRQGPSGRTVDVE